MRQNKLQHDMNNTVAQTAEKAATHFFYFGRRTVEIHQQNASKHLHFALSSSSSRSWSPLKAKMQTFVCYSKICSILFISVERVGEYETMGFALYNWYLVWTCFLFAVENIAKVQHCCIHFIYFFRERLEFKWSRSCGLSHTLSRSVMNTFQKILTINNQ